MARSTNVKWQLLDVDRAARQALIGQTPAILWFTGLSGAGKSTIANLVERRLHALGRLTFTLDGDNLRHGLNGDLGFSDDDRTENLRRAAEVARLMYEAGLITIVSTISPLRKHREQARAISDPGSFVEIFVDCPVEVCAARDPKGLYARAASGQLRQFTGLDSAYERPEAAEIVLKSSESSAEALAEGVVGWLIARGLIGPA